MRNIIANVLLIVSLFIWGIIIGARLGAGVVNRAYINEGLDRGWMKHSIRDDGTPYVERLDYSVEFRKQSGHYSEKP